MENDEFPSLEEWIESNTSHGITEKDSIRSYTEYVVDNFNKKETIDLVSTMIVALREMYFDSQKLDTLHQELIAHFYKLQAEVDLLRRNLKDLTKK
jgi:hypothetical protein